MRRFFLLLFLAALLAFTPRIYKKITHGFRLDKLNLQFTPREEWDQPTISPEEKKEIEKLLQQTFTYLDYGAQSFVFESEDHTAVLKIFKRNTNFQGDKIKRRLMNKPYRRGHIPYPQRIEKTFRATQLAFKMAREETGLLYLHLNKTVGSEPTVQIKDRLGRIHSLPLDRYSYVIQRKADPFMKSLTEALQQGTAAPLIESYLNLVCSRVEKGICNTDLFIVKNFGFINGRAIEIDFGNYIYAPERKEGEFNRFADRLRLFLAKYSPESLQGYDQQVEKFFDNHLSNPKF